MDDAGSAVMTPGKRMAHIRQRVQGDLRKAIESLSYCSVEAVPLHLQRLDELIQAARIEYDAAWGDYTSDDSGEAPAP